MSLDETLTNIRAFLISVDEVYSNDLLPWAARYDLIFDAYKETDIELEWFNPDMDYSDDVRAFVDALMQRYAGLVPKLHAKYYSRTWDSCED